MTSMIASRQQSQRSCPICATPSAIGFFTLFRKFRLQQNNKEIDSSTISSSSVPSSSSSHKWTHQVFPSFRGEDVRRGFLSHIHKEFQRKGITPFIDNEIKRGESIGLEIIHAIRESKIAIVLLSRNYASSSWCLDELVEIMKCKEEFSQIVIPIFYRVDPSDVKKLTGNFGNVFKNNCVGKTNEVIRKWRQALAKVGTTTGYDSRNWDNEATMIENIATDISNMLNYSTPSRDFDGLIGMRAHMKVMEPMLCLHSDEVRMIGIWGPSGIGKTTIARILFSQFSDSFELSVFMENVKELMYTRPVCSDEYSAKLHLQKQFMSQIINHKDIEIPHLGVVEDRLKDKKVFIVLDNIDQSIQLDAIAKESRWFGHGSRIIITTQDRKLLKAHDGINHIYNVNFPSAYEACQIFCMYAFGQKFPKDGFEELAWEVAKLLGGLPLGLRVMGSHFRGMSKHEWINALPRLRTRLDANIQSILKFSYNALCEEDKDLFLYIACLFNNKRIEKVEEHLAEKSLNVKQGLHVLTEKSLISIEGGRIKMHNLLEQLGKEIVRHGLGHQPIREPGKRQFLVDTRDICELLTNDTGSKSVIGIHFYSSELSSELNISERAFEGMPNLKFLRFYYRYGDESDKLYLPQGLNYLSQKLKILEWDHFPLTCMPSNFCTEYLVELNMRFSKLHKLWGGNRPLANLKWMYLNHSKILKELPDLSTATNLQELFLVKCSSLVELPSSIGKATNLQKLYLNMCTSLVELPSSIGNLHKLQKLTLNGCSKLEVLPANINLESLDELDLTDCLVLKRFPEISTNIKVLKLIRTAIREVPSSIKSWPRLRDLEFSYNQNLKGFMHALDIITTMYFNDIEMQEIPLWVKKISRLQTLILNGCKKLVSLPQLPDSLSYLKVVNCESLERLDCSFHNPKISLGFVNCLKLNKEAKELIIQITTKCTVLPGREVPVYFTHRTKNGSSLRVNLNRRPLSTASRFKACILLVNKDDKENEVFGRKMMKASYCIIDLGLDVQCRPTHHFLPPSLTEHLYIFDFEADVTSNELFCDFQVDSNEMVIKECGIIQL